MPGPPFGGQKGRGTGVEGGLRGLNGCTDLQVVPVRKES